MRKLISIFSALVLGVGLSLTMMPAAQAAPGEYRIVLDDPTQVMLAGIEEATDGVMPMCSTTPTGTKQSLQNLLPTIAQQVMTPGGAPVTLFCELEFPAKLTGAKAFTGKAYADFGQGEVEGTLDTTCNVDLELAGSMKMTVSNKNNSLEVALDDTSVVGDVSGTTECSFTMDFPETASMVGTITGTLDTSSEPSAAGQCPAEAVSYMLGALPSMFASVKDAKYWNTYCLGVDLALNVVATGGTGELAGNTGPGTYGFQLPVPFFMLNTAGIAEFGKQYMPQMPPMPLVKSVSKSLPLATPSNAGALTFTSLKKTKTTIAPALVKSGKAYVLGKAPNGTYTKAAFTTSPNAKVSIVGVYKSKTVTLAKPKKTTSGVFTSKLTSKTLQKKLKAKAGAVVTLKVTSAVPGAKKVTKSFKVKLA